MNSKTNETKTFKQISHALQKVGIKPYQKTRDLLNVYSRKTFAVDDTILIISSPNFRGWSSPSQIKVTDQSEIENVLQIPSFDELSNLYGPIPKPKRNESKYNIIKWEKYSRKGDTTLSIKLGKHSMEDNIAIEFMARHPLINNSRGEIITLYQAYLSKFFDFWNHLPNLITVTPVIITLDNKVLVTRRSTHVYYYPAHWEISISEQMNPDQPLDNNSYFFGAIERGVKEELGQIEISSIRVLGFYREVSNLNINIGALVNVALDEIDMQKAMQRAEDKDERSVAEFQPWELENAVNLLKRNNYTSKISKDMSGPFHPSARMRLLLAILADFPQKSFIHVLQENS